MSVLTLHPFCVPWASLSRSIREALSVADEIAAAPRNVQCFACNHVCVDPASFCMPGPPGFSVSRSIREAPSVADEIAAALREETSVAAASSRVWLRLWPQENRTQVRTDLCVYVCAYACAPVHVCVHMCVHSCITGLAFACVRMCLCVLDGQ